MVLVFPADLLKIFWNVVGFMHLIDLSTSLKVVWYVLVCFLLTFPFIIEKIFSIGLSLGTYGTLYNWVKEKELRSFVNAAGGAVCLYSFINSVTLRQQLRR